MVEEAGVAPQAKKALGVVLRMVGVHGAITLVAAGGVAAATGGVSLLVALIAVLRIAARTPTEAAAAERIIVLGARLREDAVTSTFAARLDRALALARRHPAAGIIVLGGRTGTSLSSEAAAGKRYLVERGMPAARVALEEGSAHTLENLRNLRARFGPAPGAVLVSSRTHLLRCALMAETLEIPHAPCAAEPSWRPGSRALRDAAREAFFVHWYVIGRALARLTRNRAMLRRIA